MHVFDGVGAQFGALLKYVRKDHGGDISGQGFREADCTHFREIVESDGPDVSMRFLSGERVEALGALPGGGAGRKCGEKRAPVACGVWTDLPEARSPDQGENGEAILYTFFGVFPNPVEAQCAFKESGPSLSRLVRELAHWILVAETSYGAKAEEIRIGLRDSVLSGTEVRIRARPGDIHVEFVTTSLESYEFMTLSSADLSRVLNERMGGTVVVEVTLENSRSVFDEGHSRQRHDGSEEAADG